MQRKSGAKVSVEVEGVAVCAQILWGRLYDEMKLTEAVVQREGERIEEWSMRERKTRGKCCAKCF